MLLPGQLLLKCKNANVSRGQSSAIGNVLSRQNHRPIKVGKGLQDHQVQPSEMKVFRQKAPT